MSTRGSGNMRFCKMPVTPPRVFKPEVSLSRRAIMLPHLSKWANGTILHYYFFTSPQEWTTNDQEKQIVRQAFAKWMQLGIGVDFQEVSTPGEAEIRIGFLRDDGAWSFVGRENLNIGRDERTMNFGWDLTEPVAGQPNDIDTATHEIGHSLGLEHEHQSPKAGIVWDEEAVYAALAAPPNKWSRETTYQNIIKKLVAREVEGSDWDPDSIMEYPFEAGLIKQPEKYHSGLQPAGGLSQYDIAWVRTYYPPQNMSAFPKLEVRRSADLDIAAGLQKDFIILPPETRQYTIQTFGLSDSVMTLFEEVEGKLVFRAGFDDSGEEHNAKLEEKLFQDKKYVLRIRLFYSERQGETAVMMW